MSQTYFSKQQIEKIQDCNNAISVISEILNEFQTDSECLDEIPESIKNGRVIGGLLDAIKIAAETSDASAQWLEERMHHIDVKEATANKEAEAQP
ncbi:hypothetical protein [Methylobacter luteus]|uniref:hypothetical protein n=1 Tax=Methylobacter luteus TaxID=415 RepID=UPI00041166E0|nr:hypothetical protein [Methylobacter luteus]